MIGVSGAGFEGLGLTHYLLMPSWEWGTESLGLLQIELLPGALISPSKSKLLGSWGQGEGKTQGSAICMASTLTTRRVYDGGRHHEGFAKGWGP